MLKITFLTRINFITLYKLYFFCLHLLFKNSFFLFVYSLYSDYTVYTREIKDYLDEIFEIIKNWCIFAKNLRKWITKKLTATLHEAEENCSLKRLISLAGTNMRKCVPIQCVIKNFSQTKKVQNTAAITAEK